MARVLLIDDDPDIQTIGRMALETLGDWSVDVASDGAAGLEKARAGGLDVILLDVSMPGWSGPETLQHLQSDPDTSTVPVIFLTARVQASERQAYLAAGAIGVLEKPFDVTALSGQVKGLLPR